MDDRWEAEVVEYGAINITGFRIVDASRKNVREFLEGWVITFGIYIEIFVDGIWHQMIKHKYSKHILYSFTDFDKCGKIVF